MNADNCERIERAHRTGQLDDAQRGACDRGFNCSTPAPGSTAFGETYAQFRDRLLDEYTADNQAKGMAYTPALLAAAEQVENLFRET